MSHHVRGAAPGHYGDGRTFARSPGMNAKIRDRGMLSGLAAVIGGWNVLPSVERAQRAIPEDATNRALGQEFSQALNDAAATAGVEERVQTDGVISAFHVQVLFAVASSKAAQGVFNASTLTKLRGFSERPNEFIAEIPGGEQELVEMTKRLQFIARTRRPQAKPSKVVPVLLGLGVVGLIWAKMRRG